MSLSSPQPPRVSPEASDADASQRPPDADAGAGVDAESSASFSYRAELGRKALHLLALVVPAQMAWLGKPVALYLLGTGAALGVATDVARAYSPTVSRAVRRLFGPLMRDTELPPVGQGVVINGATSVLVGAALLTWIFPIRLAVPVFVMVMVADAAAALVGRKVGRRRWPGQSHTVEGSLAFVVTGLAVWACFPTVTLAVGAWSVGAAAVAEALPLPLNDNIRVPLVAAFVAALAEIALLGQPVAWFL